MFRQVAQSFCASTIAALCLIGHLPAQEVEPVLIDEFQIEPRDSRFHVNFGKWTRTNGVLVASQLDEDKHAAAARWHVPLQDGTVRLKVMLGRAKAFHVGFDPARGELDKKGHLYSLVITPQGASILKHRDKRDAASENEILANFRESLATDEWITVELHARGEHVTAHVGDHPPLKASDETFGVKKPGVVFRVVGQGVYLKDVEVEHRAEESGN